jgi:O-antigen/teichoic acid export membrane protein
MTQRGAQVLALAMSLGSRQRARSTADAGGVNPTGANIRRLMPASLRDINWRAHRGFYVVSAPLLNAFAVGASLIIPGLLGPAEFGRYVVAELFARYVVIADLGLAQVLDRRVPPLVARGDMIAAEETVQHVLWTRTIVGGACGAAIMVAACSLATAGKLSVALPAVVCAAAYGMFSLAAAGPVAAWRAASKYRPFVLSASLLNIGLSLPRLIGAWLGGVIGCFLALAAWYGFSTVLIQRRLPLHRSALPSLRTAFRLLAEGLPLFAAGFGWAVYLVENRLVYATITGPAELGQFAFGGSILTVLVTTLSMTSAVYYPTLAGRIATAGGFSLSAKIVRDLAALALAAFACSLFAILVIPTAVALLYPRFTEAVAATRILLASGPPFVVASWLMQIVVAVGRRPWADALTIFPASLSAVAAGILFGHAVAGMSGAAAGSVAGTLVCPTLQLAVLSRSGIILPRQAAALSAMIALITGVLAGILVLMGSS